MNQEEYETSCEICYKFYRVDNTIESEQVVPKILPCCFKTFCMTCLKSIYDKNHNNILCPFCRSKTDEHPRNLPVDLGALYPVCCPFCSVKQKSINKFNVEIIKNQVCIACEKCLEGGINLREYLDSLSFEVNAFNFKYCQEDSYIIDQMIEANIDCFISRIKEYLSTHLKKRMKEHLVSSIKDQNFKDLMTKISVFNSFSNNLSEICKYNHIDSTMISNVKKIGDFFIQNSGDIVNKTIKVQSLIKTISIDQEHLIGLCDFIFNLTELPNKHASTNRSGIYDIDSKLEELELLKGRMKEVSQCEKSTITENLPPVENKPDNLEMLDINCFDKLSLLKEISNQTENPDFQIQDNQANHRVFLVESLLIESFSNEIIVS